MEPNDEPRDQIDANLFYMSTEISKLRKVNAELLKALKFAEARIEQAREEEREACIDDIRHLMICGDARDQRPTYDRGWSEALLEAETNIRARVRAAARGETNV